MANKDKQEDSKNSKPKKKLTRKEVKALKKEKKNWEAFAALLTDTMDELRRVTRFNEMCETVEKFIRDTDNIFQGENEEVNGMLEKFERYLDKIQAENRAADVKSRKLIEEVISLYNTEVGGDLVFDGDVEKWFRRVFPLIELYAKNNSAS